MHYLSKIFLFAVCFLLSSDIAYAHGITVPHLLILFLFLTWPFYVAAIFVAVAIVYKNIQGCGSFLAKYHMLFEIIDGE